MQDEKDKLVGSLRESTAGTYINHVHQGAEFMLSTTVYSQNVLMLQNIFLLVSSLSSIVAHFQSDYSVPAKRCKAHLQ